MAARNVGKYCPTRRWGGSRTGWACPSTYHERCALSHRRYKSCRCCCATRGRSRRLPTLSSLGGGSRRRRWRRRKRAGEDVEDENGRKRERGRALHAGGELWGGGGGRRVRWGRVRCSLRREGGGTPYSCSRREVSSFTRCFLATAKRNLLYF